MATFRKVFLVLSLPVMAAAWLIGVVCGNVAYAFLEGLLRDSQLKD